MIRKILGNSTMVLIVLIWVLPFCGLLITSLRDTKHANETGFWKAFVTNDIGYRFRLPGSEGLSQNDEEYLIRGNLFDELVEANLTAARLNNEPEPFPVRGKIESFGTGASSPQDALPGESLDLRGGRLTVQSNGDYTWAFTEPYSGGGKTIGAIVSHPPTLGLRNYRRVFADNKIPDALINSFIVTIPATIIPITIAAFAAYAFSWMRFPGRDLILTGVIALMVVPLQLAFIPVLSMYGQLAEWASALNSALSRCQGEDCVVDAKSFAGLWLAHAAFGLPLAIYLLRNYIVGLPRELIESARVDGASHLQIFVRIIVPLSVPALASFAIFQFLWVWNDLLVALMLGPSNDLVLPIVIQKQIGTFKSELERLNASAFVSMIVPLAVFILLQRYFVRGLLSGSVKGG